MSQDTMLITDAEREQALTRLQEACVDGRLTLAEFSERTEAALTARTQGQLTPVTADLTVSLPVTVPKRTVTRRLVAVMGSSKQSGRWRLAEQSTAIAVMGDCEIDLRRAEIESTAVTISAYAIMGDVTVIVPEGIAVDLNGIAIMGDKTYKVAGAPPLPGAPLVRVQAFACMGSVKVESRSEAAGRSPRR